MHGSQFAHAVALLALPLASIVKGQGFYANVAAENAQCTTASTNFLAVACYKVTSFAVPGTLFGFSPQNYVPSANQISGSPSTFAGFWSGNAAETKFNDTVAPLTCAQACRGYGFRYAALANNNCYCGMTSPSAKSTAGASCTQPCSGDYSQTCGGTSLSADIQLSVDPSFIAESSISTNLATLKTGYKYLGCFYTPNFPTGNTNSQSTVGSKLLTDCANSCATLGYPMMTLTSAGACSCGQSFGAGSYRIDLSKDATGYCNTTCSTGLVNNIIYPCSACFGVIVS